MKTWAELTAALGPEDTSAVERFLGTTPLSTLTEAAAAYDQDVVAWARAAAVLQRWIEDQNLEATAEKKLGYLSCAAEGIKITPAAMRPDFCRTVEDFLTTYGFSGT
jgi:hypothetical protein